VHAPAQVEHPEASVTCDEFAQGKVDCFPLRSRPDQPLGFTHHANVSKPQTANRLRDHCATPAQAKVSSRFVAPGMPSGLES
jgi:hypothetical protein